MGNLSAIGVVPSTWLWSFFEPGRFEPLPADADPTPSLMQQSLPSTSQTYLKLVGSFNDPRRALDKWDEKAASEAYQGFLASHAALGGSGPKPVRELRDMATLQLRNELLKSTHEDKQLDLRSFKRKLKHGANPNTAVDIANLSDN